MAWVTKAALSSLADVSAAALVSQPTQTRAAVDARVVSGTASAVSAALANNQTVKDAAIAAMQDAAVQEQLAWVKGTYLADGTDFNSLSERSMSGIIPFTGSRTYPNNPFPGASGMLTLEASAGAIVQTVVRSGASGERRTRRVLNVNATPKQWTEWEDDRALHLSQPRASTIDLDAARTTQDIIISSGNATVIGWPADVARVAAHVQVRATSLGVAFQQMHTYGPSGTVLVRQTRNVGETPFPWTEWVDLAASGGSDEPAPPASLDGLSNTALVEDWSRRMGGRLPLTTGAVALRFDHGLANFDTLVRPLLEARGLPYSLALNSSNWNHPENTGVTAEIVDGWVTGGLAEIWNHGRGHIGATTEEGWRTEIETGLSELRAQIPSAQIDGFAIPGTAGIGFGDFGMGASATEFTRTAAGRCILEHHAVSSGYIAGTSQRVLDGRVRQGQAHFTIDSGTLASVQSVVTTAQTNLSGLQLMLHPSLVNNGTNITAATLESILDYIVAERDAGRLAVLSPYQLMLADTTAARASQ